MPKINIGKTKIVLIKYFTRSLFAFFSSILLMSAITSMIFVKMDIDLDSLLYVSVLLCAVTSYFTGKISVIGIRNNKGSLCLLSTLPLLIMVFVNFFMCNYNLVVLFIKISVILVCAYCASLGKSKIKV